mgnify:CR=1 FL=1
MDQIRVFVRDRPDYETGESPLIGELTRFLDLEAIGRHMDVGSWRIVVPAGSREADLLLGASSGGTRPGPGGKGIVLFLNNGPRPVFSGPIRKLVRKWDKDNPGTGVFEISGPCDNIFFKERIAWNAPHLDIHQARAGSVYWQPKYVHLSQSQADALNEQYDTDYFNIYVCDHDEGEHFAHNAAEVIRTILTANLRNPYYEAIPGRIRRDLVVPWVENAADVPDDNSDAFLSHSIRFTEILPTIQMLGGMYGIVARCLWSPEGYAAGTPYKRRVHCRVRQIRDLTDRVVLSPESGTVQGYEYTIQAPEATRVIVGGGGEGKDKYFQYISNRDYDPPGWTDPYGEGWTALEREWNITAERYVDESIEWQFRQDPGKPSPWALDPNPVSPEQYAIDRAARRVFDETAPSGGITLDVVNTPECRYGEDYELSDLVRVQIDGETRHELVREVRLSYSAEDGLKIQPTVGDSSTTPQVYRQIRRLWDRVTGTRTSEDLSLPPITVPEIVSPAEGAIYPHQQPFDVTGTVLPDLDVELYWAEPSVAGWQKQWKLFGAGVADSGGAFTFPGVQVVQTRPWRKFKVKVSRGEDGATAETLPFFVVATDTSGNIARPAVTSPLSSNTAAVKKVTCNGFAPPGAQIEIEHLEDGEWRPVSLESGTSTTAGPDGTFSLKFEAYTPPKPSGKLKVVKRLIQVRVRYTYEEHTSPWQTTNPSGTTLGYRTTEYVSK